MRDTFKIVFDGFFSAKTLRTVMFFAGAAAVFMVVGQAIKYIIPDPQMRVMVCLEDTPGQTCESLKVLVKQARKEAAL